MQALFHPPDQIDAYGPWLRDIREWRRAARAATGHRDDRYRRPEARWLRQAFSIFLVNLWDRELQPEAGRLNPEELLARLDRDYGGTDILMLWNGYPRIGLDDRNQFDFWRDLPGGLAGVRDFVSRIQERGLKVAIPYLPWDGDTTRPKPAEDLLVELVEALQPDILFLDTLSGGERGLLSRLEAARPGLLFMPEALPDESRLGEHVLSWMQGQREGTVPGVIANRLFEQQHALFEVRRWQPDHQEELQRAWLNGTGTVIWENVFGTWIGTSRRFRETHRIMRRIHRRLGDLLAEGEWTPAVPLGPAGVHASSWEKGDLRFVALVKRSGAPVANLRIPARLDPDAAAVVGTGASPPPLRAVELTTGRDLTVDEEGVVRVDLSGDFAGVLLSREPMPQLVEASVASPAGADGYGVSSSTPASPQPNGAEVPEQPVVRARDFHNLRHTSRSSLEVERRRAAGVTMLPVASTAWRESSISYRVRECHFLPGVDDFHWLEGKHVSRCVPHRLPPGRFMISRFPVTNAQFARFLRGSGYTPADTTNFLRHWGGEAPPRHLAGEPVTWITPEDARACAAWYGARLPDMDEWQLAAESASLPGTGGREGAGQGMAGLGTVWELTEAEYDDGHTRFIMLRGGSSYRAEGSPWYFDGGPRRSDWASKMILFCPGIDRAATVGFRLLRELS